MVKSFLLRALILPFAVTCVLALPSLALSSGDSDIVSPGSGLTLGRGWYSREVFDGRPFRWVANNATIVIHSPKSDLRKISVNVQGGPGLADPQRFALQLLDAGNHQIALVEVPGSQNVRFDIPVSPGKDAVVRLHVDGGGKRIPKDPRVLNFRVFDIADASSDSALGAGHPDISSGGIAIGKNWYLLEEYNGEIFRWVTNDAEFSVRDSKSEQRRIEVTAASGPAVQLPSNWTLMLEDSSGKQIGSAHIKARGTAYFDVPLTDGSTTFKFHVSSNGAKSPNDPRILSFRVFQLRLD